MSISTTRLSSSLQENLSHPSVFSNSARTSMLALHAGNMRLMLIIEILILFRMTFSPLESSVRAADAPRSQLLQTILQHSRNLQRVPKRTGDTPDVPFQLQCCPSETHIIHPRGGISREGKLVELFRNYRTLQTFYQTSCKPEIEARPCSLIDEEWQPFSRCVQKYTYVYAFMRTFNISESYRLDYFRLKTGCSCELELQQPKKT